MRYAYIFVNLYLRFIFLSLQYSFYSFIRYSFEIETFETSKRKIFKFCKKNLSKLLKILDFKLHSSLEISVSIILKISNRFEVKIRKFITIQSVISNFL